MSGCQRRTNVLLSSLHLKIPKPNTPLHSLLSYPLYYPIQECASLPERRLLSIPCPVGTNSATALERRSQLPWHGTGSNDIQPCRLPKQVFAMWWSQVHRGHSCLNSSEVDGART